MNERNRIPLAISAVVILLVAILAAADLVGDLQHGVAGGHLLVEAGLVVACVGGFAWFAGRLIALWREARSARAETLDLSRGLAEAKTDAERWRQEADRWRGEAGQLVAGLSVAIDRQLESWALTAAEKEVALLLLKGLSHKELAALRGTSEATVRQQARTIYRKAGLSGRADLAAFFLEDLLVPLPQASSGAARTGAGARALPRSQG